MATVVAGLGVGTKGLMRVMIKVKNLLYRIYRFLEKSYMGSSPNRNGRLIRGIYPDAGIGRLVSNVRPLAATRYCEASYGPLKFLACACLEDAQML